VRLRKADRQKLDDVLAGGIRPVRTVLRALVPGHLNGGKPKSLAWSHRPAGATIGRVAAIRVLLLHHDLEPWREKDVVRGRTQGGLRTLLRKFRHLVREFGRQGVNVKALPDQELAATQ
jgi:hypothetical protein